MQNPLHKTLTPALTPTLTALCLLAAASLPTPAFAAYTLRDTGQRTTDPLTIHIRGIGAPAFTADQWTSDPPPLVPDIRHPLIQPAPGQFRNIYAPSAVPRTGGGWDVYYGGWDGAPEGRDAIYVTPTTDFLTFGPRKTVILPGPLQHVCNVNGQPAPGGGVTLMCTAFPDPAGLNKPVLYHLPDSAPAQPIIASPRDMIHIEGYDYAAADINGMNVLLRDGDRNLVYFGDFKNFGAVRVATAPANSPSTTTFHLAATALQAPLAVNDVKILRDAATGKKHYLMGLHMNGGALYYALSDDPLHFTTATELLRSADHTDRHIVALGWVTDPDNGSGARRILGVLYGAGHPPTLDANRIFARWIQKPLTFSATHTTSTSSSSSSSSSSPSSPSPLPAVKGALGPSTAVITLPTETWTGNITIAGTSATAPPDTLTSVTLTAGHVYELFRQMPYSAAFRNRRSPVHKPGQPHDPNCDCPELPWVRP